MNIDQDTYKGELSRDLVDGFVCGICFGIVYEPQVCNGCERLYCKSCVKKLYVNDRTMKYKK